MALLCRLYMLYNCTLIMQSSMATEASTWQHGFAITTSVVDDDLETQPSDRYPA
jgi:hypothetical protein